MDTPATHKGAIDERGEIRAAAAETLTVGPICLDFESYVAQLRDRTIALTRLEFDLLAYLMQHARKVVSQEELVRQVTHGIYHAGGSLIRVHMTNLRRKLGADRALITTVRGRGFRFLECGDSRIESS
jgi:DNA-binding response OmpR family regulator